jgi:hypothetical protein
MKLVKTGSNLPIRQCVSACPWLKMNVSQQKDRVPATGKAGQAGPTSSLWHTLDRIKSGKFEIGEYEKTERINKGA